MDYQIDMGDHGWKHPEIEHYIYGSKENACQAALNKDLDPEKVFEVDSRPEIWRVAEQLRDEERVWEEGGVHVFPTIKAHDKWPEGRIKVFVVTGSNEGLYLHVEVKLHKQSWEPEETVLVLIAKTLNCDTDKWYECWMSAARIARMLGA